MQKKKIFSLIAIGFILCLVVVPLVSASYICPAQWWDDTPAIPSPIYGEHPSATTARSSIGVSFQANTTCYLYNATFLMYRDGTPTGSLTANLYSIVGTFGTTSLPDSLIEKSLSVDVEDLQGSYLEITFQFSQTTQIAQNSYYYLTVECDSATNSWSLSNCVQLGMTSGYAGNSAGYKSNSWSTYASYDLIFVINANSEEGTPPATPTPAPSTPTTLNDGGMTALTNALLPIIVPLLVMLIPAFLGLKFVGAWGFFAGLNVGMIIAYVTLSATAYPFPLWGVVAMLIVDGLLLFGRVPLGRN